MIFAKSTGFVTGLFQADVDSLVIIISYMIFLMWYAVIINYFGKFFFQLREKRS